MRLTPEQWRRVKKLFNEVVDIPPTHRPDYLAEQCGDDAEVRTEVERLAESYRAAPPDFLEPP